MADASFVQTDFRGGQWSKRAQGRMDDRRYKSAMAASNNGMPLFNGAWTRRPAMIWGGNTRQGKLAKLFSCYLKFSEAFQLELTDAVLRVHVGASYVFTPDSQGVSIASISTGNPAVVTLNGAIPSDWANGNTVILNLTAPSTSPILSGRQFQIEGISGNTFELYDAVTGASVDGSVQPYTAPTLRGQDYVLNILELAVPFAGSVVQQVRLVQTDDVALLMHERTQPQSLTVPPLNNFAISAQAFVDGPYLNINTTSTTLTPNALSGNVTFTASSTIGINGGLGFQPTDVNRVLRFQSQQPNWSSLTTYANGALVTGSDNNIYQSQIGGNINNNPTTDNGTNWVVSGQTIVWVWGYITTVTDETHVVVAIQPAAVTGRSTATIVGDALSSETASTAWQLGVYSDTTGWPSGGTYSDGRLWLFGSAAVNRVDGSCANDKFNFAPSAPDGTVGDGNAISKISNAPSLSTLFWMLPTLQGILMGSRDGEWLIYAAETNDPLTPTTTQLRRVSTYGCANIEPMQTELTTCFVQREQQRVLNYANYPYGEAAGWFADNISEMADDINPAGIAEIRWQQEPSHFLWARCNDGSLVGTTFSHPAYGKEGYNAWHAHALGGGRTVASISTGPSDDGLTTTLFVCAFNPTSGFYEYLELAHIFDATQATWAQNFTDGIGFPSVAKERSIANGDPYNGITIYGFHNQIGETITVSMAGLDLGDFVAQSPDGHIDLPYTSTFTQAFVQGLNNGTNYGIMQVPIQAIDVNVYSSDGAGAYNPTTSNLSDTSQVVPLLVQSKKWLIDFNLHGIRVFNCETLNEITDATYAQIMGGAAIGSTFSAADIACYHPGNDCLYVNTGGGSNSQPLTRIDMSTLRATGSFGVQSSGFNLGPNGFATIFNSMIPLVIAGRNLIGCVVETGAGDENGIGVIDGDTMKYVGSTTTTEPQAFMVPAYENTNQWFGLATPGQGAPFTGDIGIYKFALGIDPANYVGGPQGVTATRVMQISPANIDAAWTHFGLVTAPAFDPTDGTIVFFCSTTDVVTHTAYWVKVNVLSASIVWKTADAASAVAPFSNVNMASLQMPNATFSYLRTNKIYTLATATGALTSVTFPATTSVGAQNQLYWPERNAVISSANLAYTGSPPGPYNSGALIPLGSYMQAHNSFGGYCLLTVSAPAASADWPPPDLYQVPMSLGANYTSFGQLLRPDYGYDAGARNGPAFGKKRRQHWFSAAVVNSQNFNISTDVTFSAANAVDTVTVMDEEENIIVQPSLYTGTLSTTMPDGYSWDSQIAWQVKRPTPLMVSAMGGYIQSQDK